MANIRDNNRLVHIELDQDDLDTISNGDTVEVECPHTGEPIYLSRDGAESYECECCGQTVDRSDAITPSVTLDRLKNGGTPIYNSVHTADDITIILRAAHHVAGGWS
jgi:hypothetical protein